MRSIATGVSKMQRIADKFAKTPRNPRISRALTGLPWRGQHWGQLMNGVVKKAPLAPNAAYPPGDRKR
jgi:hypothetical protein